MDVIDVGCGPGSITRGLAEAVGVTGLVVGIDNSAAVIETAAESTAPTPGLRFGVASVYELPFSDNTFDLAYGHQVLQHLGDPVAALTEINRVLKPGGLVAMRDADYGTMTHHPPEPAIRLWLDMYHQVAKANGGEPDAGRHLTQWISEAGFENSRITSSTWTYGTFAERHSWADLWANRITQSRFGDRAIELGLIDRTGLSDLAAGWRDWAAREHAWFAFIHGEIVAEKRHS